MNPIWKDVYGPFAGLLALFFALLAMLLLAGCGHNIVTYGDGIGLETTFRPDNGNFGVVLRYGKVLTATVRENVTVEMSGEGSGGGEANGKSSASSSASLKFTTGKQTNGYTVDAIRAKAGNKPNMPE